jgi:hypothetical protein
LLYTAAFFGPLSETWEQLRAISLLNIFGVGFWISQLMKSGAFALIEGF